MKVYFLIQGQFGNNLFQYFAAEIIKKMYNYDSVCPTFQINLDNTVINDDTFKTIVTAYELGFIPPLDTTKDILMMGFFQRSEIFRMEKEYVKSLFTLENTNHISNRITICNILKYKSQHAHVPKDGDLTLHLRCGDFWHHENNTSEIFHPDALKAIIRDIPHDKLYIVYNTAEQQWEKEYYDQFADLNPIWINGKLGDDFDFLMKSPQLITSSSTMCYMAALLGSAHMIHIPYNYFHGGQEGSGQHLAEFDERCKVYYSVDTYLPCTF